MKLLFQLLLFTVIAVLAAYGYAYLAQDQMLMATLDDNVNGVLRHAGTSTEEIAQWAQRQAQR